jgi:hypothetical protein
MLHQYIALLVVVMWLGTAIAGGPAQGNPNDMFVKVQVSTRTSDPLSAESRLSTLLGIASERVKVLSVIYGDFSAEVTTLVSEGIPTNADLRAHAFPLGQAQLVAQGYSAAAIYDPPVATTDYTIFYATVGSGLGGIVVTALFMTACCLRKGATTDTKKSAKKTLVENEVRILAARQDREAAELRARLQGLEEQLLALHSLDEEEKKTQAIVKNDPGFSRELLLSDLDRIEAEAEEESKSKFSAGPGGATNNVSISVPPIPTLSGSMSSSPMSRAKRALSLSSPSEAQYEADMAREEDSRQRQEHWWRRSAIEAVEVDHGIELEGVDHSTKGVSILLKDQVALLGAVDRDHWSYIHRLPSLSPLISSLVSAAPSNIHGMGVFARTFIDAGIVLFPWLRPERIQSNKVYVTEVAMGFRFGADWRRTVRFVTEHPERRGYFCVAEDPTARGWGCLLNSCRGTALEANCEVVWTGPSGGETPWIRTKQTVPPLAELLLDYAVAEQSYSAPLLGSGFRTNQSNVSDGALPAL